MYNRLVQFTESKRQMPDSQCTPISLVVIPTYNERESIERLVHIILHHADNLHVLIIDDNSPDGTGQIADALSRRDERIQVIHRPRHMGYASACKQGFEYALRNAYPYVVTMNADFSHNPRYIPQLIALAAQNEVAIGSRYCEGGGVSGSSLLWQTGSLMVNHIIRRVFSLPVWDSTSRFRCYQTFILPYVRYHTMQTEGAGFGVEILERCKQSGYKCAELPIIYDDRRLSRAHARGNIRLILSFIGLWFSQAGKRSGQRIKPASASRFD